MSAAHLSQRHVPLESDARALDWSLVAPQCPHLVVSLMVSLSRLNRSSLNAAKVYFIAKTNDNHGFSYSD